MAALHYLPSFHRDIEDIWLYVAQDDIAAADRLLATLYDRCLILRDHPLAGPARLDIAPDCRQLVAGSYLILYRCRGARVELVRALDGRRRITPALFSS